VSGVRIKKKYKLKPETSMRAVTCWSEAEIPSEAKRQRGTLKPETNNLGSAFGGFIATPSYLL
jgi:hypothetical protein